MPDVEAEIVAALDALRARYDYVFTTGGIGPTHDDITADAIAKAFGVAIDEDPRVIAMMQRALPSGELTPARRRMARIPAGAALIDNPVSLAPGFRIGNVIVMAGVPSIMQAMLDARRQEAGNGRRSSSPRRSKRAAFPKGATATRSARSPPPTARRSSAPIPRSPTAGSGTRSSCAAATPEKVAAARRAVEAMLAEIRGAAKPS